MLLQDRRLTVDCGHQHVGSRLLQKPTNETVEPMILSIIAIEITDLTRFILPVLLRIQRYMWHNHVATCA